jgi:hypothetical protein
MTTPAAPFDQSSARLPQPDQPGPVRPPERQSIRLAGHDDLVSAVPYLVGFVPSHSLVLASLRGPRLRWGLTARADLPEGSSRAAAKALAGHLVERVLRDGPAQIVAVVYDDLPWVPDARPWSHVVDEVRARAQSCGVDLAEAVYVGGERFWSLSCTVNDCCPPEGRLVSATRSSPAAAALVSDGFAPARSREEVEARLRPSPDPARAAVQTMADGQMREVLSRWSGKDVDGQARWARAVIGLFGEVVQRYAFAGSSVTAEESAQLLVGLAITEVRDDIIVRWTGWLEALPDVVGGRPVAAAVAGRPRQVRAADRAGGDAVERLLIDLARFATRSLAVAPLTLLSLDCWARGDGGLANIAVERALRADPTYRLGLLADQLLGAGIAPAWARR